MNKIELNEFLKNQIENNKVGHAYLFYSNEIEEFSEEILQFLYNYLILNIEKNRNEELDEEKKKNLILQIKNGIISDFNIIDGKKAKTEDVRMFFDNILKKPLILENKIYIIENFENLNESAQNVTLKTLEEPPSYVLIVIKAKNINKILDTVRSRCQKIYVSGVSMDASMSADSKKDLLLYNKIDEKNYNLALNILKDLENKKFTLYYLKYMDKITKENIQEILLCFEKIISFDIINMYKYARVIAKTKEKILSNANFEMTKDYLLKNLWEAKNGNSKGKR